MENFNKIILLLYPICIFSNPICNECDKWIEKLSPSEDILIFSHSKKASIVGGKDTMFPLIKNNEGPFGEVFVTIVVNDRDEIECFKIIKGDISLHLKVKNYLDKQKVESGEVNGKKVYDIMTRKLRFVSN